MPQMNMIQAINSAMDIMLERDSSVVVMGQDVGYFGGVFRCTDGLQAKHGEHRVLDAPISEGGIVGTAIGMGVNGLRPVAEIQFADYIFPAIDQIVSEMSRLRYRTAGQFTCPAVVRTPCGGGIRGGNVIGTTDKTASEPTDTPYSPDDAAATFYHAIGIDNHKEYYTPDGRPVAIVRDGKPISALWS